MSVFHLFILDYISLESSVRLAIIWLKWPPVWGDTGEKENVVN
jgi:hypothetical protein